MTRILLHSPLDPVAAALKLKAAGESPPDDADKWVAGSGSDRDMRLWVVRRNVRNDFKPMLTAQLTPERGGTRIEGRIGRARFVTVFMALWIGFVGLFALGGLAGWLFGPDTGPAGLMFVAIPVAMLCFAALLLWFGRWLGRGDEEMLLAFLESTIDARKVVTQDAGVSR